MMGEETWAMRAEQNSRPAFEAIQQIVAECFGRPGVAAAILTSIRFARGGVSRR